MTIRAGMGRADVRLAGQGPRRRVRKTGASAVELAFYRDVAPRRVAYRVRTPRLHHCHAETGELELEYVPGKIDRQADRPAMIAQLARLHDAPCLIDTAFRAAWPATLTARAVDLFRLSRPDAARLFRLQTGAASLFEARGMICGDSNPGNWARRLGTASTLVQFDWERAGYGHPAIDLAPLAYGLPDAATTDALAATYIAQRSVAPGDADCLSIRIRIACAWLICEVITTLADRDHALFEHYRRGYGQQLPAWLADVTATLD
ncbi:phosphotransferase family protein [Salinisphaera sp. Q1T1-3]|uniref:phosphotransferase family protein n=1 Tax=Salinisphaera sp. Q1T1-3 TaxID=2321229 RepID=UPI000E709C51|nr:phosphotransferase [Salinisphaera sp. Q1T1-3]RJS93033.1 hypothetical protein D3260_09025 [Salinisphaera sp. Q1T1-3]